MELSCPVRGCGAPMVWGPRQVACPKHTFDVAKSGYCSLLQPQDRKSLQAGDSRETVAARRRSADRGIGAPLIEELCRVLAARGVGAGQAVLDAGCGEGAVAGSIARKLSAEVWGCGHLDGSGGACGPALWRSSLDLRQRGSQASLC